MNTDRFRFRVWDEYCKEYLPDGVLLDGRTGMVAGTKYDGYVIEQCTGLKDKNGNLIFEKDIVRFYWTEQDPQEFVVRWNNVRSCIDFNMYKNGKRGCKFDRWWECFDSGKCDFAEVIGNIHDDQFREVTKKVGNEEFRQCKEWLKQELLK